MHYVCYFYSRVRVYFRMCASLHASCSLNITGVGYTRGGGGGIGGPAAALAK